MIDARRLVPIPRFRTLPRDHARPLPVACTCETLHGHCYVITCRCERHREEITR